MSTSYRACDGAVLGTILIAKLVLRPSPCSDANWVSSFDKKGWSNCDNNVNFITGFYRSKLESFDNDDIYRLEKAKCCPSSSLYTNLPSECRKADWLRSFDVKGTLSSCPFGYFLNGLYRSQGNKLHNIEYGECCKPSNHPNHYDHCYYEDIKTTFDKEGLSECLKIGYYVTGIYRNKGNTDGLHNVDLLKCCKMSLQTVVLRPSPCSDANWVFSFDKEGWSTCDNNANFITGFYRSKRESWDIDEIYKLEKVKCCPSSSLYKNQPSECKKADWMISFDIKGTWSVCPSGYFLTGLFRSGGNNLHNIEEGECCKPGNHALCYDDCYHENIEHTFDKEGWSQCQKTGYYVTGIHRNLGKDELHNLDKLKCCKMWSGA